MRIGYEGVPFFFVLSGFVLTWSARQGEPVGKFYARRFARVWPLLAVTFLPAMAIVHFWNHAPFSPGGAVATLTLTQAWTTHHFYTANIVTWTLSCEAFFYLSHPLLVRWLSRLNTTGLLTATGAMTAFSVLTHTWPGSGAFSFEVVRLTYASPLALMPMFIIGMCTAMGMKRGWRPRLGLFPVLGMLTLIVAARWRSAFQPGLIPGLPPSAGYFDAVIVPIFALLIAVVVARDIESRSGVLARPTLVRLGEWSFAFYLVHYMVLTAFRHFGILSRVHSASDRTIVMIMILASATSIAGLCHLTVEAPADQRIRRLLAGTPS
jgi:peptidoglycan/LPS O-acetylase OafA/YrhL